MLGQGVPLYGPEAVVLLPDGDDGLVDVCYLGFFVGEELLEHPDLTVFQKQLTLLTPFS